MSRRLLQLDQATLDRFFSKVEKKPSGCWEWAGGGRGSGYGGFTHNGSGRLAHRVSYEIHKGSIPAGLCVCHKCDNRKCVNPQHLFAASQFENMQDMKRKGRAPFSGKTGHRHPTAKLTAAQAEEIRRCGLSNRAAGKKYGVHHSSISRIRTGHTYVSAP